MNIHDIKIKPCYFEQVIKCNKTFEIRKNDLNYSVGDIITLHEFDGEKRTGRQATVLITYVLKDMKEYGLQDGYCIFSWNEILVKKLTYD